MCWLHSPELLCCHFALCTIEAHTGCGSPCHCLHLGLRQPEITTTLGQPAPTAERSPPLQALWPPCQWERMLGVLDCEALQRSERRFGATDQPPATQTSLETWNWLSATEGQTFLVFLLLPQSLLGFTTHFLGCSPALLSVPASLSSALPSLCPLLQRGWACRGWRGMGEGMQCFTAHHGIGKSPHLGGTAGEGPLSSHVVISPRAGREGSERAQ